jgi:hypothetical protein
MVATCKASVAVRAAIPIPFTTFMMPHKYSD